MDVRGNCKVRAFARVPSLPEGWNFGGICSALENNIFLQKHNEKCVNVGEKKDKEKNSKWEENLLYSNCL